MKMKLCAALLCLTILCGIAMLAFGISGSFQRSRDTKYYETTEGYFIDYRIYSSTRKSTSYQLIYAYQVDGEQYTVATDLGTSYIPEKGSARIIQYNPENPAQAVLSGANQYAFLILMGVFFILVPTFIGMGALSVFGRLKRTGLNLLDVGIGVFFVLAGGGVFFFQASSLPAKEFFRSFGPWILIPILFLLIGIYQIIRSIRNIKKRAS